MRDHEVFDLQEISDSQQDSDSQQAHVNELLPDDQQCCNKETAKYVAKNFLAFVAGYAVATLIRVILAFAVKKKDPTIFSRGNTTELTVSDIIGYLTTLSLLLLLTQNMPNRNARVKCKPKVWCKVSVRILVPLVAAFATLFLTKFIYGVAGGPEPSVRTNDVRFFEISDLVSGAMLLIVFNVIDRLFKCCNKGHTDNDANENSGLIQNQVSAHVTPTNTF